MSECLPCRNNAIEPALLPVRERVYDDGLWRVAHAFNSALPGWMVVVARRHITSLSELTAAEAAALGPLLRRLSAALEEVLGASKAYVIFLAEAVTHVHIHVIPRLVDLPPDRRGADIFAYLGRSEAEWVSADEMDRIARDVRRLLEHHQV
jgi:diadenosine tetraphosphate (Ap4A) HIT family hydrolase